MTRLAAILAAVPARQLAEDVFGMAILLAGMLLFPWALAVLSAVTEGGL